MSLISRHKKPGAFEKLVNSLELTSLDKREKIIEKMAEEDPEFMDRIARSILNFQDFKNLKDEIILEITFALEKMQHLVVATYKLEDKDLEAKLIRCIPAKRMGEFKTAKEEMAQVTRGQRESAQFKIIETARRIQKEKGILIKPYLENLG